MSTDQPLPFVTPAEYVAARSHVFAGVESLRWFERSHRDLLIERGALLMPAGRKLIDPAAFDGVVAEVGRRMAGRRAGKHA